MAAARWWNRTAVKIVPEGGGFSRDHAKEKPGRDDD
jgi:hypothetical protein